MGRIYYLTILVVWTLTGCSAAQPTPTISSPVISPPQATVTQTPISITATTIGAAETATLPGTTSTELSTLSIASPPEIPDVPLSERLPDGYSYEVLDDQSKKITSGDPVPGGHIYATTYDSPPIGRSMTVAAGYTERVQTIRVRNGTNSEDVVIFTVRYFLPEGKSASVTYSIIQSILNVRSLFGKILLGAKTGVILITPMGNSFTSEGKAFYVQTENLPDFQAGLVINKKYEFLTSSQLMSALDNAVNKGELDLSFRVVVVSVSQYPTQLP